MTSTSTTDLQALVGHLVSLGLLPPMYQDRIWHRQPNRVRVANWLRGANPVPLQVAVAIADYTAGSNAESWRAVVTGLAG